MKISYTKNDATVNVVLAGELDTPAAGEIQPVVDEIIALNPKDIVIDCKELEYIASSGLRLFLAMRKVTRANGGSVTLNGTIDSVRSVFKVTNFDRIFNL